ncbi:MAG: hypothetical protein AAB364_02225 [Patescibacteria group bacterium]
MAKENETSDREMDPAVFEVLLGQSIRELVGEVNDVKPLSSQDREKLQNIAAEAKARHDKLKATVSSLQDSMDYLRLAIKYLIFDLEATRRENNYLRAMLEKQSDDDIPW